VAPDGSPTDVRLALILRRLGAGGTITAAGVDAGVTRKTILRWRSPGAWCVTGFGEACDRVSEIAASGGADARAEIERIVLAWTPAGCEAELVDVDFDLIPPGEQQRWAAVGGLPVLEAQARPVDAGHDGQVEPSSPVTDPDVLDTEGREIVGSRAPSGRAHTRSQDLTGEHLSAEQLYPKRRAPTRDEWNSMMADLAMDSLQPASVRCAAIASGNASFNQAAPRRPVADPGVDPAVAEAASKQGRDPGVPASVWQQARQNFLGPAPDPEPDATRSGDVVEFERAPPG
jgi:hypothetical protein